MANTAFDLIVFTGAIDDGGVFLGDVDLLGRTHIFKRSFLEAQPDFFRNHRATGQHSDVCQHGLAAVAETRRLHGSYFDDAADGVHHQCRQRFAFDVLGHDQQRTAGLGDAFEHRQ